MWRKENDMGVMVRERYGLGEMKRDSGGGRDTEKETDTKFIVFIV